jgi:hypothetical protein
MHIGYFYDALGRRRGRLAVFRSISSEEGAYFRIRPLQPEKRLPLLPVPASKINLPDVGGEEAERQRSFF